MVCGVGEGKGLVEVAGEWDGAMTTRNGLEKVVMVPLGSGYGKTAPSMPDVGVGVMEQMRDELLKMRVEKATRREPAQQPKCPRDESQQPS